MIHRYVIALLTLLVEEYDEGNASELELLLQITPFRARDVDVFALDVIGFEERLTLLRTIVGDIEILHGLVLVGLHLVAHLEHRGSAGTARHLPEVDVEDVEWMFQFVETIRALPMIVSCERHDYAVAAISHVPHVISASLVNLVKETDDENHFMKTIAAGGFKDITRMSSSSPVMWEQICMTNTDNIRELLDKYIDDLMQFRRSLDTRDNLSINHFFDSARQYRESFADFSSGPIKKMYILHVDIEDRPGVLAEVVMYLAIAGINIKNIGITHNREYQQGVLRVECHSSDGLEKARELLTNRNYSVY